MQRLWNPGHFERGGNTKTHGIVRAEFIVRDDLPENMRRGIYAEPRTYRAWVRFSGPGPYITRDIDDVGFMSISVKLMGVPGPKLLDDEQETLDMFGVSTPTFVTPDTKANAQPAVLELPERVRLPLRQPPQLALPRLVHAAALDEDADEPARGRLLQLRPLPARRRAGDAVLVRRGEVRAEDARAAPAAAPARQLPPRRDGRDARRARRRVRRPAAAADRPVQDADREQRRPLADEAVAARAGRRAPDPAADVRLARAARVRAQAHLQPLAHDRRAPPARQPEPGAEADVLRALAATAGDERRRALRADRRRDFPGSPPIPAPRGSGAPPGRAGRSRRRP